MLKTQKDGVFHFSNSKKLRNPTGFYQTMQSTVAFKSIVQAW